MNYFERKYMIKTSDKYISYMKYLHDKVYDLGYKNIAYILNHYSSSLRYICKLVSEYKKYNNVDNLKHINDAFSIMRDCDELCRDSQRLLSGVDIKELFSRFIFED